jgi:hypothetical protein
MFCCSALSDIPGCGRRGRKLKRAKRPCSFLYRAQLICRTPRLKTAIQMLFSGRGRRGRKLKRAKKTLLFSATASKNPLTDHEVHFINADSFQ